MSQNPRAAASALFQVLQGHQNLVFPVVAITKHVDYDTLRIFVSGRGWAFKQFVQGLDSFTTCLDRIHTIGNAGVRLQRLVIGGAGDWAGGAGV